MKIKIKIAGGNVEISFDNKEEFYDFVNEWPKFKETIRKMND